MRNALLFFHIVGVAGWLGAGAHSLITHSTVARLEPPAGREALRTFEKKATLYFSVTSGLVILSGVGLLMTSDDYGWGDTFVLIGLGAFVVSGVIQSVVGRKNNERLLEAATSGADVEPAVRAWQRGSMWDFLVLFVAIWTMITKLGA